MEKSSSLNSPICNSKHVFSINGTLRRCPESRRRCWSRWSPCCPRSWCRRPGYLGTQRTPGKRWSGMPPWSPTDLKTHARQPQSCPRLFPAQALGLYLPASLRPPPAPPVRAASISDRRAPPGWCAFDAASVMTATQR